MGRSLHLLSWVDVGVDVFEDRLECGVVADAQVLDLNLSLLRPVVRHLRGPWNIWMEKIQ